MPSPPPPGRFAKTTNKSHGRREIRTLRTTSLLTFTSKWSGLKQAFELTRERIIGGKRTIEITYGITSLSEAQANAADLLKIVRDHWQIENCLHYVRDVTLREDACRVRSGTAPQVLAALRNSIVHLLPKKAKKFIPETIERLQIDPGEALKLIGIPRLNKGMALPSGPSGADLLSYLSDARVRWSQIASASNFRGDRKMTSQERTEAVAIDIRKSIFLAVLESQDGGTSVAQSRADTARQFSVTVDVVKEIEREGIDQQWPPL